MHTTRRAFSTTLALGLAAPLFAASTAACAADAWPSRTIKLIVPYPAGGPTDAIARLLGAKMAASLGQPVVVDNRAGAGGTIGVAATLAAPADGYTLALVAPGPLAGMPNLMKTSYALDDIQYLTLVARIPSVLVVSAKSGIDSLESLVKTAKATPGKLSYSSAGTGTTPHIGMEIFKDQAGVDIVHVPYKGAAPALTAVVSGEVQAAMVDLLPILPFVKAGQVKPVAVAAGTRASQLPDVATTKEHGLPNVLMETNYGLITSKGVPAPIAAKLREAALAALNAPATKQLLLQQGAQPVTSTAADYQKLMSAESAKWKNIIAKARITLD